MAGYSDTPLLRKIGVRDEHLVLLDRAPEGFELGDTAAQLVRRLPAGEARLDVTLTFHTRRRDLEARLPGLFQRTRPAGMVWVCWPKKAAQRSQGIVSDLDEDVVRGLALEAGWVDVKVAAVDDTWSGLKLVRRRENR